MKFSSDHTWRDRILGTGHRLLVCLPVGLKSLPVDIRLTSEEFLDFVDRTKLTGAELIEQMREKKIGGNVWGLALMQIREVFIEEREVSRKRQEEEEEKIRKEMEAREEQMRIQLEEQRREDGAKFSSSLSDFLHLTRIFCFRTKTEGIGGRVCEG